MKKELTKYQALVLVSLMGHAIWLVIFFYLIAAGPFRQSSTSLLHWLPWSCDVCAKNADAIYTASQMGRLEMLSISLTVLATVIGIGAFASFFLFKRASMDAAVEHVDEKLSSLIDDDTIIDAMLENDQLLLTLETRIMKAMSDSKDANGLSDAEASDMAAQWSGWEEET